MKLFRDLGRLVESGIFFSFEARVELPHVKHWANSSSIYSTTAWFASSRKHSGSSTLRASQTCIAAGQNPLGPGREWEATSASSYTSFSAKGKAKSARCARCSNVEFVFTSGDYKRLQNKITKQSWQLHRPMISPAAAALSMIRASLQASLRPPAPFLLPMAVQQSVRRSAGHRPNTPSEPRRQENPAG